jgi:hypothetical protein
VAKGLGARAGQVLRRGEQRVSRKRGGQGLPQRRKRGSCRRGRGSSCDSGGVASLAHTGAGAKGKKLALGSSGTRAHSVQLSSCSVGAQPSLRSSRLGAVRARALCCCARRVRISLKKRKR